MKSRAHRPRRRRMLQGGINLVPMLDVMLNLLFFFMLATSLQKIESEMKVALPSSETAPRANDKGRAVVVVDSRGEIHYKGRAMGDDELELEIRQAVKGGMTEMGIRGDEAADFGRIVRVMDVMKRAGLREVLINANRKSKEGAKRP